MSKFLTFIRPILSGAALGVANVIPGISGGTIAVVLGIYEKLIGSIKSATGTPKKAWQDGSFSFLAKITLGALGSVMVLADLILNLFSNHTDLFFAVLAGIVAGTIFYVIRGPRTDRPTWSWTHFLWLGGATAIFFLLRPEAAMGANGMTLPPMTVPQAGRYLISGILAAASMILPGISGSLVLVILGTYTDFLMAIKQGLFLILGLGIAGAIIGIKLFSNLIHWLLETYPDHTQYGIAGLLLGSTGWLIVAIEAPLFWPNLVGFLVGFGVTILGRWLPSPTKSLNKIRD